MVELVDTQDLKFCARNGRVGSNPTWATINGKYFHIYNKEYCILRYAIFKVERIHFKWKQIVAIMRNRRKSIGTICLMAGMFFNPLGYAEIFALVMKISGDYWTTAYIFYVLAFLFFSLSIVLLKVNPIKRIIEKIRNYSKKDLNN